MERPRLTSMRRETTEAMVRHIGRELLQNLLIDTARRPRSLVAAPEPEHGSPG